MLVEIVNNRIEINVAEIIKSAAFQSFAKENEDISVCLVKDFLAVQEDVDSFYKEHKALSRKVSAVEVDLNAFKAATNARIDTVLKCFSVPEVILATIITFYVLAYFLNFS